MGIDFSNLKVRKHMLDGNFGLEKESLRVTPEGFLSHTKHPFPDNPNMERDFCENQTELITNVAKSTDGVWEELSSLHQKAVKTLLELETGKEFLWPFSNPPYVKGEHDIPIASFQGHLRGKELYREYLASKYGKKKMLFSGIHFNFSFSEDFLKECFNQSKEASFIDCKNNIYLNLAKNVAKYSWLIVYLTAASPVMDGSFFHEEDLGKDVLKNLASPRCSHMGYWNDFEPILEYDTIENYVKSIEAYVEQGQLKEAAELYYPVRLKPKGENSLENLKTTGINHIELRMLDLNPLEPVGIKKEDLRFLHLLIVYFTSLEEAEFLPLEQMMAVRNEKKAAQYEEDEILIDMGWDEVLPIHEAALQILTSMEEFYDRLEQPMCSEVIRFQKKKLLHPNGRYAVQIREQFKDDYVKRGLELANEYADRIS
jgi:glutamate--cysteine ligase